MKKFKSTALSFVMLAAVPLSAHAQDPEATANEISEAYKQAFNEQSAEGIAELYADDAVVLPPNADRVQGKDGVAEWQTMQFEQMGAKDLDLTVDETRQLADAIYQSGTYSMTVNGPNGEMPVAGDWLTLAEPGPDGKFLITRHIYNVDMPQAAQ
ncbi:SgcJ/EcaC family oxidoreductase [Aliihoeflea sp. 2WW]|uniref:YybH family protein n=1 Tax=Aliihoeflea sp. 2WW TaxID=1381123 RepID=UPI0004668CA9|nr:SgcJ/EcaC family oxidoreductase [Aliihoeflea sp. 2WW]